MKRNVWISCVLVVLLGFFSAAHAEPFDELQGVWQTGLIEDESGLVGDYRVRFEFVDEDTLIYSLIRKEHDDQVVTVRYEATNSTFVLYPFEDEDAGIKVMESSWEIDADGRLVIRPDDREQPIMTFERVAEDGDAEGQ